MKIAELESKSLSELRKMGEELGIPEAKNGRKNFSQFPLPAVQLKKSAKMAQEK